MIPIWLVLRSAYSKSATKDEIDHLIDYALEHLSSDLKTFYTPYKMDISDPQWKKSILPYVVRVSRTELEFRYGFPAEKAIDYFHFKCAIVTKG